METEATATEKTCRYGHGALKVEPNMWTLKNIVLRDETSPLGFRSGEIEFVLKILYCTRCGYIELADQPMDFK